MVPQSRKRIIYEQVYYEVNKQIEENTIQY